MVKRIEKILPEPAPLEKWMALMHSVIMRKSNHCVPDEN